MAIDTSGQVTIRGEGSATTTNLQQGLCKMWCQYDGSGTAELDDSFNCSGITDNATGDFTLAIANDMSNDDYAVSGVHGSSRHGCQHFIALPLVVPALLHDDQNFLLLRRLSSLS